MPKVRMNYDGWLALPAAMRQKLGVDTGNELEVEVVDGKIVLRPLTSAIAAESPAAEEVPPAPMQLEPGPAVAAKSGVKRGPGRPRKTATAPPPASTVLPPHLKARGAKRKAPATGEAPR
jgi:bifunctional DNA-binding transcriptional regulator/antitoxin component of YhaV-PrlF toxin-antitoxin module